MDNTVDFYFWKDDWKEEKKRKQRWDKEILPLSQVFTSNFPGKTNESCLTKELKGLRWLTYTLHGVIGCALIWRAADVTFATVWIQALLTFCAKIVIETCFTIFYFTFWKTKRKQKERIRIRTLFFFTSKMKKWNVHCIFWPGKTNGSPEKIKKTIFMSWEFY